MLAGAGTSCEQIESPCVHSNCWNSGGRWSRWTGKRPSSSRWGEVRAESERHPLDLHVSDGGVNSTPQRTRSCTQHFFGRAFHGSRVHSAQNFSFAPCKTVSASSARHVHDPADTTTTTCTATRSTTTSERTRPAKK